MKPTETPDILIGEFDLPGNLRGKVYFARYQNLAPAIRVTCMEPGRPYEVPYGSFSINLAEASANLCPWSFFAKTYAENALLALSLKESPWFEPCHGVPLRRAGSANIPTWRLKPQALSDDVRDEIAQLMKWPMSVEREAVRPSVLPAVQRLHEPLEEDESGQAKHADAQRSRDR